MAALGTFEAFASREIGETVWHFGTSTITAKVISG